MSTTPTVHDTRDSAVFRDLPPQAWFAEVSDDDLTRRPFGIYVHVPYCRTRCGYCDFNTYTAEELGGHASRLGYAADAIREIRFARRAFRDLDVPVHTVFFGGGTPTVLPVTDLVSILRAIDTEFGLIPGAEVSIEANPETVDAPMLGALTAAGFTRISFGMQSAVPAILALLDRKHTPGLPERRVAEARAAGFAQVNLDLIYGTPGESDADWRSTVQAAIDAGPTHVSAYALTVEPGTALARRVRRGEIPPVDDDVLADRYQQADELLSAAGYHWYEISNWAFPGAECRHNLGYWRGRYWWGIGPGAHSHVADRRWWNVKHPNAYAERLLRGLLPVDDGEILTAQERHTERVMLGLRLVEGLALDELSGGERTAALRAAEEGLLQRLDSGRCVLTLRGRMLADAVVRSILCETEAS